MIDASNTSTSKSIEFKISIPLFVNNLAAQHKVAPKTETDLRSNVIIRFNGNRKVKDTMINIITATIVFAKLDPAPDRFESYELVIITILLKEYM